MALINCPECGKEISDKAESCPNCGLDIIEYNQKLEEQRIKAERQKRIEEERLETEQKRLKELDSKDKCSEWGVSVDKTAERFEKADIILDEYFSREYRQKDIAEKHNIPVKKVGKVLQARGFEHTKLKSVNDPYNLNPGQTAPPLFMDANELDFLDKYDIKRE